MPEQKLVKRFPRGGQRAKPYGYSYLTKKVTPEEKLRVIRYIEAVRDGLIEDLGPREDSLSTAQVLLIDRACCLLSIIRAIETYHQENILTDTGELRPIFGKNYLSFVNSCRLILCSLGVERHGTQETIQDLIREFDAEKEEEGEKAISAPVAQDLE